MFEGLQNKMGYTTLVFACCIASWFAPAAECANILAIQTIGGLSHWKFMTGILDVLVDDGNNVTVITPFLNGNRENYTEVDVSDAFPKGVNVPLDLLLTNFSSPFKTYSVLRNIGQSQCDQMYRNVKIAEAMNRSAEFETIIIEPLWSNCGSYMAAKMNLPLIYVSSFSAISFMESSIAGGYSNPLTYANILLPHSYPRTFMQKFTNVALLVQDMMYGVGERFNSFFDQNVYGWMDTVSPSTVFVNSHAIIEKPRPNAKLVVDVGGIHLRPPKPLPADIEEFINNSTNGVIYFALGATLKMSSIPKHIFNEFIAAFEELPMNVLVKYEEDINLDSTKFMARKWFPQRDILAHPNVKVYLSNGGQCGILEAVDAGIPVVGIPLMGDQPRNIDNLVEVGMAVSVPFASVTKETILKSILEVLQNKKYVENANKAAVSFRQLTKNYKDVIVKTVDSAIYLKDGQRQDSYSGYWLPILLIVILLFAFYHIIYRVYNEIENSLLGGKLRYFVVDIIRYLSDGVKGLVKTNYCYLNIAFKPLELSIEYLCRICKAIKNWSFSFLSYFK